MNHFFIKTLGCKVNQAESEAIAESLREAGWVPAATGDYETDQSNGDTRDTGISPN